VVVFNRGVVMMMRRVCNRVMVQRGRGNGKETQQRRQQ
jgi:hypothetical protein